ncbi:hypothetical protein ABI59_01305 [Acidobacteria bacterium Mor1]|nr:hypothetical protein ABI59_01305 [Acidobacteria bacterium Mor1]
MNRRDWSWFAVAAALIVVVFAAAPAFPQAPGVDEGTLSAEEQLAEAELAQQGESETDTRNVEEILQQQEALLRGERFSYDPGGRRDPFISLFERTKGEGPRTACKGIGCMTVDEIDLVGIVEDSKSGDVAFFNGSDNRGYFLRVGDGVYDASMISIDARKGIVTFRQQVDDPRLIKPYRDVVKRLVPQEESGNE